MDIYFKYFHFGEHTYPIPLGVYLGMELLSHWIDMDLSL